MNALPDPSVLDALARSVAAHAAETRARAAALNRAAAASAWHGPAATVFAERAARTASALHHCGEQLDAAAHSLYRHARTVEQRLHALQGLAVRAEHTVDELVTGAAHVIGL